MKLSEIFEKLEIEPHGSIVFFHIASDTLKPIASLREILSTIDEYFDERSTICMPSFPFFGSGYYEYLKNKPVFDIRKTPSKVNLITEVFRRRDGVIRSLHPWCSVACKGYLAKELTSEHYLDAKVFGKKSPFGKISENNGYVVGLGVDCNTNSFAHMPDDVMLEYYSFKVYEDDNIKLICIDYHEKEIEVETNVLHRTISKIIKPRKMRKFLLGQDFYKECVFKGINFYALKLKDYIAFTVSFNIQKVKEKGYPIYYEFC